MQPQVSYQTAVMPESVIQKLTIDDSPDMFYNFFWEFMGVDIQNAYIHPWDFENILDMVDIKLCELFQEYPEELWDNIVLIKYITYIEGDRIKRKIEHVFQLSILWSSMRAKMYVKMCRAREGFALRQLTESRSTSKYEGMNPMMPYAGEYPQQQERKTSKWRL